MKFFERLFLIVFAFIWTSVSVTCFIIMCEQDSLMALMPFGFMIIGVIIFVTALRSNKTEPKKENYTEFIRKDKTVVTPEQPVYHGGSSKPHEFDDLLKTDVRYCPLCGTRISLGAKKCPSCKSDL